MGTYIIREVAQRLGLMRIPWHVRLWRKLQAIREQARRAGEE